MVKAYDPKVLIEKLKGKGLNLAEEAATIVVEETLNWVSESAIISENKMDDILAVIIPVIKPHIMRLIDKIDGEVDAV